VHDRRIQLEVLAVLYQSTILSLTSRLLLSDSTHQASLHVDIIEQGSDLGIYVLAIIARDYLTASFFIRILTLLLEVCNRHPGGGNRRVMLVVGAIRILKSTSRPASTLGRSSSSSWTQHLTLSSMNPSRRCRTGDQGRLPNSQRYGLLKKVRCSCSTLLGRTLCLTESYKYDHHDSLHTEHCLQGRNSNVV
jgi:hypothetical protein